MATTMFNNVSIRAKLAAIFGLALIAMIGAGYFSLFQTHRANEITRQMREQALPKINILNNAKYYLSEHSMHSQRRLYTKNFRQQARINQKRKNASALLQAIINQYSQQSLTKLEANLLATFHQQWARYQEEFALALGMLEQGQTFRAKVQFDGPTLGAVTAARDAIGGLSQLAAKETLSAETRYEDAYRQTLFFMIGGTVFLTLAGLLSYLWVSGHVSRPLLRLSSTMRQLTNGNESAVVPVYKDRTDEIGILSSAANAYRESVIKSREMGEIAERERSRLKAVISSMPVGLCMFDEHYNIIVCNDQFRTYYKVDKNADLHVMRFCDIITSNLDEQGKEDYANCATELFLRKPNDSSPILKTLKLADERHVDITIQRMHGGWVSIHKDMTQQYDYEAQILHLAQHDPLTGLPNRNLFSKHIESSVQGAHNGRKSAILFLDLDRFKYVNDTFGHNTGDQLLKVVVDRLRATAHASDVVSRLGGDEFAIIHTDDHCEETSGNLASRIIKALQEPVELNGQRISIGISIGIAILPEHGNDSETILKSADIALYQSKNSGRGQFSYYNSELDADLQQKRELVKQLESAIAENAFEMHYQPLIDAASGRPKGVEALMRWPQKDGTFISPAQFIPLAEEYGLITKLGEQAIWDSIKAATHWPEDIRVAINLSPAQLSSDTLFNLISQALDYFELAPNRLELEITETVLFEGFKPHLEMLGHLHAMGVRIALDDFGTGYSSLSHLRLFPFDKIKVDASFIKTMEDDPNSLAIVRAAAGLSKSLGIDCTAEGVETHKQLFTAQKEGFTELQGYLFSKAMPEAETGQLLQALSDRSAGWLDNQTDGAAVA